MAPGQFRTGLCDCFAEPGGTKLCCITTWLPCITLGENNEWVRGPLGWFGGFLVGILDVVCLGIPGCLCTFIHARETQRMKDPQFIEGPHMLSYFLKSCCCLPCMICVIRREQIMSQKIFATMRKDIKDPMNRQLPPQQVEYSSDSATAGGQQADDPEAIWTLVDPESLEETESLIDRKA